MQAQFMGAFVWASVPFRHILESRLLVYKFKLCEICMGMYLAGCRTWCPTDLQHLCCKALINKINK